MIEHISAVVHRLEEECEKAGSQAAWADKHGLSRSFVNDVLQGRRDVTDRLAKALGFQKVVLWKDLRDTGKRRGDY